MAKKDHVLNTVEFKPGVFRLSRVLGLGFRVWVLGFRVWGLGCRV